LNKAYILVGVPGSGKSTWAKSQSWLKDCAYISTDDFVEEYAAEQGKTYSEVFNDFMPTAVDLMSKQVLLAREKNKDIIWDQTSTTIAARKKKFRMLPDYYHIAVVFKTPVKEELTRRLNSRSGKIIPLDVIQSMIDNYEPPTEEEGYKEIWYATSTLPKPQP
jgi:predicted kinase